MNLSLVIQIVEPICFSSGQYYKNSRIVNYDANLSRFVNYDRRTLIRLTSYTLWNILKPKINSHIYSLNTLLPPLWLCWGHIGNCHIGNCHIGNCHIGNCHIGILCIAKFQIEYSIFLSHTCPYALHPSVWTRIWDETTKPKRTLSNGFSNQNRMKNRFKVTTRPPNEMAGVEAHLKIGLIEQVKRRHV